MCTGRKKFRMKFSPSRPCVNYPGVGKGKRHHKSLCKIGNDDRFLLPKSATPVTVPVYFWSWVPNLVFSISASSITFPTWHLHHSPIPWEERPHFQNCCLVSGSGPSCRSSFSPSPSIYGRFRRFLIGYSNRWCYYTSLFLTHADLLDIAISATIAELAAIRLVQLHAIPLRQPGPVVVTTHS